jgi:hypothetical protein
LRHAKGVVVTLGFQHLRGSNGLINILGLAHKLTADDANGKRVVA